MTRPNDDDQTSVCVLTPAGRGAVAVVAVKGHNAVEIVNGCFLASNGRSLDRQPVGRIVYGHWGNIDGEDLVVCRRTEDEVEVHCHGGAQSVAAIVSQLANAGCHEIPWQEWIAREHECPLVVEAQIALAEAATSRTALILLDQLQGALRNEAESILAAIQAGEFIAAIAAIEKLLAHFPCGQHLTDPWQVVLAGPPNVGKSSLKNALVGYRRAIVFDQPGTTRDVVSTNTVIEGWPIQLSDTAGLHATTDPLEAAGIQQARAQLARADLVVWVEDATATNMPDVPNQRNSEWNHILPSRQLAILNKVDLAQGKIPTNTLATSALTGQGIEHLLSAIVQQLVPEAPASGAAIPFTTRQADLLQAAQEACGRSHKASAAKIIGELLGLT